MNIKPTALYWAIFNTFEMRIPGQAVLDICHPGDNEPAVKSWVQRIKEQVKTDNFKLSPTPDKIRKELSEHGAWEEEELQYDDRNFERLVWIAAWNINEDEERDCSEPLKN
jgi:hypothetical protein